MRRATVCGLLSTALFLATRSGDAKVARTDLADLVKDSDFIGIVRVADVSSAIPMIRQRRATATVLQSWKGQRDGEISFLAEPTWACDISDAEPGEEAVLFVRGDRLVLAGRGRMPIFLRAGRRLAAIWSEVILPADLATEDGPKSEYEFIRGVSVERLGAVVARLSVDSPVPK